MHQSDCPGRDLYHSGLHDVEIHQLPAAAVERTSSESVPEEEIFLLKGQVQERLELHFQRLFNLTDLLDFIFFVVVFFDFHL